MYWQNGLSISLVMPHQAYHLEFQLTVYHAYSLLLLDLSFLKIRNIMDQ